MKKKVLEWYFCSCSEIQNYVKLMANCYLFAVLKVCLMVRPALILLYRLYAEGRHSLAYLSCILMCLCMYVFTVFVFDSNCVFSGFC